MKKKILMITLTICTIFTLNGCAKNDSVNDLRGNVNTAEVTSTADKGNTTDDNTSAKSDSGVEEEISLGHNESNTYENTFLGIGCKFDEKWKFNSDEENKALFLNNAENIDDISKDVIDAAMENGNFIIDMMVINQENESNVSVGIVKSDGETEETYVDSMVSSLGATMESAYGLSNVQTEKITVNYCGEDHIACKLSASIGNGYSLSQIQVAMIKGNYLACITATAYGDQSAEEMLNAFYPLDK